ncbi:ribonucleoside-triphosphate reductase [Thermococcus sp. LS2]|uniref:ribonucleoside-triphosphate reductase n=1 Tax=Thermococcus sp. LS2 TaxID=1638260 RepID=UPI001438DE82|nr:ribonucleoside-triphosphate reductase [Thermococcus sp. LS2]
MNIEKVLKENLEREELWLIITFKTPYGPGETMDIITKVIEELGWKVNFKANWWTADIPYGLIRIDASYGDKEKIILGKWILGSECQILRVDNMELEEGKEEFFRMVDSITSTLIHDPVIRTMREQY